MRVERAFIHSGDERRTAERVWVAQGECKYVTPSVWFMTLQYYFIIIKDVYVVIYVSENIHLLCCIFFFFLFRSLCCVVKGAREKADFHRFCFYVYLYVFSLLLFCHRLLGWRMTILVFLLDRSIETPYAYEITSAPFLLSYSRFKNW